MEKLAIVDDSSFQRRQISKMLADLGFEVASFSGGNEFLASENIEDYICVFTDLLMPEIDGIELTETFLQKYPQIPVIVISANIQQTVKDKCKEVGARGFVNKPVNKDTLKAAIEQIKGGGA